MKTYTLAEAESSLDQIAEEARAQGALIVDARGRMWELREYFPPEN